MFKKSYKNNKMANLKVSIIIPAYNEEKTIARTIKSLKMQSYKNFEIIVVDNNSKDKTKEIASRYAKTTTETKQGYISAVKRGVSEATGDILTFCDADSFYKKNWLKKMVKAFKNKRTVAVYGTAMFYDTNIITSLLSTLFYSGFLIISKIMGLDNTAGFNFLFRKNAYEKAGGYDENWKSGSPDIEFGTRLKKLGRVSLKMTIVMTSSRRFKKGGFLKTTKMFFGMWKNMLSHKAPEVSYEEYNSTRR